MIEQKNLTEATTQAELDYKAKQLQDKVRVSVSHESFGEAKVCFYLAKAKAGVTLVGEKDGSWHMRIVRIEDCGGTDIYCGGTDIYCGGMDKYYSGTDEYDNNIYIAVGQINMI